MKKRKWKLIVKFIQRNESNFQIHIKYIKENLLKLLEALVTEIYLDPPVIYFFCYFSRCMLIIHVLFNTILPNTAAKRRKEEIYANA